MNKTEFSGIIAGLSACYPTFKVGESKETLAMWYKMLSDISYPALSEAATKYIATNVYPPTIADLRKLATERAPGDWSIGWGLTLKAISRYGYYREQEALAYLESCDEMAAEVVRRLGFQTLCLSENQQTDRANFRMAYEALEDSRAYQARLPEHLRNEPLKIAEMESKAFSEAVALIKGVRGIDD